MDVAYDAVQKEAYPSDDKPSEPATSDPASTSAPQHERTTSVSNEFRDAYNDFSTSSWGAKLGGWWSTAKTQGQSYYEAAQKELSDASTGARGAADLTGNTGAIAISKPELDEVAEKDAEQKKPVPRDVPESLGKDIVKEAGSLLSGFQFMAGERLKKVQAAEDAADEALVKFGTNLRNYLQDAVKITAPEDSKGGTVKSVMFESKDQEGRRVVHATRLEAQLHVIHSNPDSFMKDPDSPEYAKWKEGFDAEKKTDTVADDLAKYDELRRSMEKLVPEKVEYGAFWTRYYFLRHVVEEQEQKRKELLKGAGDEEEVKWDDDDEDEEQKAPSTPKVAAKGDEGMKTPKRSDTEKSDDLLKPAEGRRSNENSVADSDTSYDIVSGVTSRGPGSPKEDKEKKKAAEQSDDEDWE